MKWLPESLSSEGPVYVVTFIIPNKKEKGGSAADDIQQLNSSSNMAKKKKKGKHILPPTLFDRYT